MCKSRNNYLRSINNRRKEQAIINNPITVEFENRSIKANGGLKITIYKKRTSAKFDTFSSIQKHGIYNVRNKGQAQGYDTNLTMGRTH